MGGLKLPEQLPKFVTGYYLKSELDKVALEFRRAAVIFRLQAIDCERPDEDDLPMMPLLAEVEEMVRRAGIMMIQCKEKIEWDDGDEFYNFAFFFHYHVRGDRAIRKKLYEGYGGSTSNPNIGRDEWDPLRQAWKVIIAECLAE
jgi:hypothetical protein